MGAREGMSWHLSYRKLSCRLIRSVLLISILSGWQTLRAQEPVPAGGTAPSGPQAPAGHPQEAEDKPKADSTSEISQTETAATFKVRVNLVQVRVIVRDPSGKAIDNLTKQDFLLYDQGKLQYISNFSVETPQSRMQRATDAAKSQD